MKIGFLLAAFVLCTIATPAPPPQQEVTSVDQQSAKILPILLYPIIGIIGAFVKAGIKYFAHKLLAKELKFSERDEIFRRYQETYENFDENVDRFLTRNPEAMEYLHFEAKSIWETAKGLTKRFAEKIEDINDDKRKVE